VAAATAAAIFYWFIMAGCTSPHRPNNNIKNTRRGMHLPGRRYRS